MFSPLPTTMRHPSYKVQKPQLSLTGSGQKLTALSRFLLALRIVCLIGPDFLFLFLLEISHVFISQLNQQPIDLSIPFLLLFNNNYNITQTLLLIATADVRNTYVTGLYWIK